MFKHKQLELQLAEAKMAQQHLQFNEDKEKTLSENQLVRLLLEIMLCDLSDQLL